MKKISPFWLIILILTVLAAVFLCIKGYPDGILLARPSGKPQKTVTEFLNLVECGDYKQANTYLSGYSTLGFENIPDSEEGVRLFQALKNSYDYTLSGDCICKELKATQKILLTRLDVGAVTSAAALLGDSDYLHALDTILADKEQYYTSDILDISLEYIDHTWKIIPDSALICAFQGGVN